jgi:hypothetical protein
MAQKKNSDSAPPDKFKRDMMDPLNLLLDAKNPRLFGTPAYETSSQDLLLQTMWSFGVVEIVESISATGYQSVEPLFVEHRHDGKFVVIEGNRRLTALQLLLDPERAKRLKITGIPPLKTSLRQTCLSIPVAIGRREDVWTFIATKHLNGPKTWDSLAKAGYVKYVHEDLKQSLKQIKESIGDRNGTSIRMYESLRILEQAETWKVFNREDHAHKSGELPFSHLYTLIGNDSARKYLGLSGDMREGSVLPSASKQKLGELLVWIFGSAKQSKAPLVKSQNPDVWNLASALQNSRGVRALRAGHGPEVAAEIADGDEASLIRHLTNARDELQDARRRFSIGCAKDRSKIRLAFEEVSDAWKTLLNEKSRLPIGRS